MPADCDASAPPIKIVTRDRIGIQYWYGRLDISVGTVRLGRNAIRTACRRQGDHRETRTNRLDGVVSAQATGIGRKVNVSIVVVVSSIAALRRAERDVFENRSPGHGIQGKSRDRENRKNGFQAMGDRDDNSVANDYVI